MRRLFVAVGAAAAVFVAISVMFLSSSRQAANAAQMLQQVVATNSAYKGWVHIRCSVTGSQEKQDAEVVDHANKADGIRVFVARTSDEFRVIYQSLARGESTIYSSKTNELRTSSLNKLTTLNLQESLAEVFLTPDEVLRFLSAAGSTTHGVSVTREDGSNRFDITSIDLSSRSPGSQPAGRTIAGMVVRADAATGLISQVQVKYSDSTALILDMTYGQPEISSVYDVGVPRDAKVVDNRPDQMVHTILDSMAAQRDVDAGDYVAVMTEELLVPQINDVMPAGMTLYAQTGDGWLWADYRIQDLPPGYPVVRRGWPQVTVLDALEHLRPVRPIGYIVVNGSRLWTTSPAMAGAAPELLRERRAFWALPVREWAHELLDCSQPDAKMTVCQDESKPGLLGVRVDTETEANRFEIVYWMDPARSNMPVSKTERTWEADGKTQQLQLETRYLQCRQLPGGLWYPVRWEVAHTPYQNGQRIPGVVNVRRLTLEVVEGLTLDPVWFSDPAGRLPSDLRSGATSQP